MCVLNVCVYPKELRGKGYGLIRSKLNKKTNTSQCMFVQPVCMRAWECVFVREQFDQLHL